MKKSEIEILIPTFNEAGNIEKVISDLIAEGFNNITILDANSKDDTASIAKNLGCRVILDKKDMKGFGASVINALNNLNFDYFVIFDGDNSFNPNAIQKMMNEMMAGADFVFGSRYLNGNTSDDDTLITKFGNFFFTNLVRVLFSMNTSDVMFLYVLGKKENIKKLNLKRKDFTICTEFLVKCYRNFKCKEILSKERKRLYGSSKVNKFLDGLKVLINILSLYFQKK
jgi:glycosyltransferase involved in cell wall biosynthesis